MKWLVALLLGVLLLAGVGAFLVLRGGRQQPASDAVVTIAEQLGYTSQNHLAQFEICWDMGAHCADALYFTSSTTVPALRDQVAGLGLDLVLMRDVDGRALFTDLNISGPHSLTVNGQDGSSPAVAADLMPAGYEWWLTRNDRNVFVTLYTLDPQHQYAFDGQVLQGNVISVKLQTR